MTEIIMSWDRHPISFSKSLTASDELAINWLRLKSLNTQTIFIPLSRTRMTQNYYPTSAYIHINATLLCPLNSFSGSSQDMGSSDTEIHCGFALSWPWAGNGITTPDMSVYEASAKQLYYHRTIQSSALCYRYILPIVKEICGLEDRLL